eukprot:1116146-Ditylum_brightwellii.AAC.1
MENLKLQAVAGDDLQYRDEFTAKFMNRVKQADFIEAYLKVKATGWFFIRLPDVFEQYFSQLFKYCVCPLRLGKAICGLILSGKLW